MPLQTVLISGAGIAGPALAYWLLEYGFQPTIVERAPAFREGGYIVDFWGVGFDVAERMELVPDFRLRGYNVDTVRIVNRKGKRVGGFSADVFRAHLGDRFLSILRGDLAAAIYERVAGRMETMFADSILALDEQDDGVSVAFEHAPSRRFDLVVGADGLHSTVRQLSFDLEDKVETGLGYYAAAFSARGYRPRDEGVYVAYSSPGKQIARFSIRDDRTVFFLIFAERHVVPAPTPAAVLEAVFAEEGWETEKILDAMRSSEDLYYDSVSQIRMPTWSQGRVALVGDAAFCPSLLAGQGSSLAMAGSYALAGELKKSQGDYKRAFERYESLLKPLLMRKQDNAKDFGSWFAPDSAFKIFLRNQITELFAVPFIARRFVRGSFADDLELPYY